MSAILSHTQCIKAKSLKLIKDQAPVDDMTTIKYLI